MGRKGEIETHYSKGSIMSGMSRSKHQDFAELGL